MEISCLIVDDSPSFLQAAAGLLERQGVAVVSVASTTGEALRQTRELRPDVVLVDISLGSESGFDLDRKLAVLEPAPSVILLSTYSETDFADLIEQAPAVGFIAKSELSAGAIRQLVVADVG